MNWKTGFALSAIALVTATACGSSTSSPPSTVTVTKPASGVPPVATGEPAITTTTAGAASIVIPDLANQNAQIAEDELKKLGLTNVTLSSANPKYQMVLVPANWTVVSTDPPAGTSVSSSDTVVVKVTKP